MTRTTKRVTIHSAESPWFRERRQELAELRRRDIVDVLPDGTITVSPVALRGELQLDERLIVYRLLGHQVPDPHYPLITRKSGMVGGRAAIAGRRAPVWRIIDRLNDGETPEAVASELDLTAEELEQAVGYGRDHSEEIRQDIRDQEWVREELKEVASR